MATETEQLLVSLEARISQFEKNFQRASRTAGSSFDSIERRAKQSAQRLDNLMSSTALNVNRALGAIGLGVGFDQIRRFADAWTEAGNKIKAAAAATGIQTSSLESLKRAANEARTDLDSYVDLYARIARSSANVAKNEGEIARVTSIVAKSFKASGASASEAAAGALQLGQALGSGVLQGDELRSLMENAPTLAKAIAEAFGVPIGALKQLGAEGKLTFDKVFAALLAAGPQVEAQFRAMTATIGDSFTKLNNNFTEYVGKIAESSGVSAAFRAVIDGLAGNIGSVANAAAAAAAVLLASYVPSLVRAGAATAAMVATNPFLALAVAAGAAVFAISAFGDQITPIAGDLANLQDYAAVAWDAIKAGAVEAANAASAAFQAMVDYQADAMEGMSSSWQDVADVTVGIANALVNACMFVYKTLVATFVKLPDAIANAIVDAMNAMIRVVEDSLNAVIHAVNATVDALNWAGGSVGVELGKIADVNLGHFTSELGDAGAAAGQAYGDAFAELSKNRVGEALSSIGKDTAAALEKWRQKANEHARQRQKDEAANQTSAQSAASTPIASSGAVTSMPFDKSGAYSDIMQRIAALKAEMAIRRAIPGSIEQQEAALERQKVAQQLVNEAVKQGVALTDDVKEKIGALADAYSRASQEAKALAQSEQEAAEKAKDFEATGKSAFKGFFEDLRNGKKPLDALSSAIQKLGDKVLDSLVDNLWNGMMKNGGTDFFKSMSEVFSPTSTKPTVYAPGDPLQGVTFPNGITAPTATVNAGTVTVNGAPGTTPGTTPTTTPGLRGSIDGTPTSQTSPSGNATAASLFAYAKQLGYSDVQASAIIGNMQQESNFNPAALNKGEGAYGLLQWRQDRRDALNAYAGTDTPDAYAQMRFMRQEMMGSERRAGSAFMGTTDLTSANAALKQYIRYGDASQGTRLGYAQDAMGAYGGNNQQLTAATQQAQQAVTQLAQASQQVGTNVGTMSSALQSASSPPLTLGQNAQTAAQQIDAAAQTTRQAGDAAQTAAPNLNSLQTGISGLTGPLNTVMPGLGNFANSIVNLLSSLGGKDGGGGLLSLLGLAEGGHVSGPGTSTSDSIPALLSDGEFVVNAAATKRHGALLQAINTGRVPAFAAGGFVSSSLSSNYSPTVTVNMHGGSGDKNIAQMVAREVAAVISPADTFRRSSKQQDRRDAVRMARASAEAS